MKKFFIAIAAIATAAACSQNETISLDNGEAISFGNAFVENSVRATDPTYGAVALAKFNVYGTVTGTGNGVVNIFNGNEVTGSVGDNVWNCDNKQYWIAGAQYQFAAVADGTVTADTNGMPTSIATIADSNSNVKDLLYATSGPITGKASGNDKVNFTFDHLLSKVHFTVTSNTEGGYYYSVKNIEVANYSAGTYTIGATTPWAGTTAANVAFGDIEKVTSADNNKTCTTQKLLIPTTADFNVIFTVEIYKEAGDADDASDDVLLGTTNYTKTVSQDLVAGNAYNFTIALSVGELIQFTVTTNPTWGDPTTNVPVLQ